MQNFAASTVAATRPIDMRGLVGRHTSVQGSTPYNDGNDCGELQFKNAAHRRPGHDLPIDGMSPRCRLQKIRRRFGLANGFFV